MREIARPVARRALSLAAPALVMASPALVMAGLALAMASLAFATAVVSSSDVLAQAKQAPPKQSAPAQAAPPPQQQPPLKQVALTDAQVQSVLAATKEMDPITEKIDDDAKPDPKITAQLDGIAKRFGFAGGYADYSLIVENIQLVLGGFDTTTKKYVGAEAVIRAQIAEVQADKKMSAKDRKETLEDLNDALKSPGPAVENKGNIDLVTKYYDKLVEALSDEE